MKLIEPSSLPYLESLPRRTAIARLEIRSHSDGLSCDLESGRVQPTRRFSPKRIGFLQRNNYNF